MNRPWEILLVSTYFSHETWLIYDATDVIAEKTVLRKKTKTVKPPADSYTIFHALFEAVREKEDRDKKSVFHRLGFRK